MKLRFLAKYRTYKANLQLVDAPAGRADEAQVAQHSNAWIVCNLLIMGWMDYFITWSSSIIFIQTRHPTLLSNLPLIIKIGTSATRRCNTNFNHCKIYQKGIGGTKLGNGYQSLFSGIENHVYNETHKIHKRKAEVLPSRGYCWLWYVWLQTGHVVARLSKWRQIQCPDGE